jgi:hypothetical protein
MTADALRATLKATIDARTIAQQALSHAAKAVSHADDRINSTNAELANIGDVDVEAAMHAAARIEAGVGNVLEAPAHLATRRTARAAAQDRLKTLQAARSQLVESLEAADRKLHAADAAVSTAAQAVLANMAATYAVELFNARQRLFTVYSELSGLCRLSFPGAGRNGGMGPLPITPSVKTELEIAGIGVGQFHFDHGLDRPQVPDWRAFYTALLTDPYTQAPNS